MRFRKRQIDMIRSGTEIFVLLILFYRSILWVAVLWIPLFYLRYRRLQLKWEEERRWQLNLEFKEGLQGIAAALNAGYSVENAIEESRRDLKVLYGQESLLCWEFQIMLEQLRMNRPVEQVMDELADRSKVEDIKSFAEVFRTARRSGGDLVSITRVCAERIAEKIEVSREIRTDGGGNYECGSFGNNILFLDLFSGISGLLLWRYMGTDYDEYLFGNIYCGISAQREDMQNSFLV